MESNQGYISSANFKNSNISNNFSTPSVRSLTSADYCANPTSHPKHQFPQQGFPPKEYIPTEASYLAPIKPPGMQLKPVSPRQKSPRPSQVFSIIF